MRWTVKPKLKQYERETVRKFAFLPIRIGEEVRWLEMVTVKRYYWIVGFSERKYWEYDCFVD